MIKIIIAIFFISAIASAQNKAPKPCSSAEAHQFDFWLGDWNVKWKLKDGTEKSGSNHVINLFDGCIIEENFNGNPGNNLEGKSFSVYNSNEKVWKQTWVDNYGAYLDFTGNFGNGKMILSHQTITPKGENVQQRMVYYNISKNDFDWNWESSSDNGKTWDLKWKIHYSRKK